MVTAPVGQITSTTSATQDLQVFRDNPSAENLKLIKQKYGSEQEFFSKVGAEGYAEGFKGKELNLPATQMLDETAMKQFLDPSGLSAYKGTELEKYAGTQDYTQPIPTLRSEFAGKEVPYSEVQAFFDKRKSGELSGVTELGQLMPQGEFGDTNLIRAETPVEKFGRADLRGKGLEPVPPINPIDQRGFDFQERMKGIPTKRTGGIDTIKPSQQAMEGQYSYGLGGEMFRKSEDIWKNIPEEEREKFLAKIYLLQQKYNMNDSPTQEQKEAFSKEVWALGQKQVFDPATKETLAKYPATLGGEIEGGIDTIETDQKPKTMEDYEKEPWAKKRLEELQFKMRNKNYRIPEDLKESWTDVNEIMELIGYDKERFKKLSIKEKRELGKKFGLTWTDIKLWEVRDFGSGLAKVIIKTAEDKKRAKDIALNIREYRKEHPDKDWKDEARTRERILKEGGQRELDKYILDLAKEGDTTIQDEEVKKDSDFTKITEEDGVIKVGELPAHPLIEKERGEAIDKYYIEKALKRKLNKEEQKDVETNLKNQGVETKGLTDKNMLLIAMGLGMMASEKPGLTGVGEGALAGLKIVAPLMKEKSSDIQMITVKNDEGENVIVRYNKKKGTYEQTGLKSGTTSLGEWDNKIKALAKRSTLYNEEDITNIMIHSMLYSKDKPKAEAIRLTMGLLSSRIPELTKDAEALRKLAEDIVKGNIALDVSASDIGLKT